MLAIWLCAHRCHWGDADATIGAESACHVSCVTSGAARACNRDWRLQNRWGCKLELEGSMWGGMGRRGIPPALCRGRGERTKGVWLNSARQAVGAAHFWEREQGSGSGDTEGTGGQLCLDESTSHVVHTVHATSA